MKGHRHSITIFGGILRVKMYRLFLQGTEKNYNYITSKKVNVVNEGEISSKIENVKE